MITRIFLTLSLLAGLAASVVHGQVQAQLVALTDGVEAGRPLTVALRLDHEEHWHTYWVNAGTGYPTSIEWELPEGWRAGSIQWPTPIQIIDSHGEITGNGYEGTTYLPVELIPSANLAPGEEIEIKGMADWLMCADVCIPGNADLSLALTVGDGADTVDRSGIERTISTMPFSNNSVSISASRSAGEIELVVSGLDTQPVEPWFFEQNAFVEYNLPQSHAFEDGVLTMKLPVAEYYDGDGKRLIGILRQEGSWVTANGIHGLVIDVELGAAPIAQASNPAVAGSLLGTLVVAFLGGLVLNLMPCVFPVLGIKILGFVNQAGSDRKKVAAHGWVFSLGVLSSFWSLAGVLAILRAGGDQLGWGFQLQSPLFVFALASLLLVFALSMSGVFEFGLGATGVGASLQSKEGYSGSFFTGVLATVVATPCSAPFLAPALGAALALPIASSFLVFTAIAVGLSTPYLLLSLFPDAIKLLPRPGAWMETFKEVMAFPLYATVGWLVWVLIGQTTESGSLMVFMGLTLVAMGTWFYGRYNKPGASKKRGRIGLVGGLLLLVAGFGIGLPKAPSDTDIVWEKWSDAAVAQAIEDGRPVYVDFTARWCATCQTNKKLVFTSSEVKETFQDRGVVTLKADWTNKDPLITKALAKWNRSAVPFNLIYLPDDSEPVVLPEILTPGIVLKAFEE